MSVEPGVVDANVLVYAANINAPQHAASLTLLNSANDPSATLYITSQTICEFYSVVTNPRRVTLPLTPADALSFVASLLDLPGVHVLLSPASTVQALIGLLERHPVSGAEIFDLQLVAAMRAHRINRIYTFNVRDFEVFSEINVVIPGMEPRRQTTQ